MKLIGLCGGSGSGKTSVAAFFAEQGFLTLDADKIYHGLVSAPSPCLTELVTEFGTEILKDNSLDRKKLAEIVFAHGAEDKKKRLNEITHKHVLHSLRKTLEKSQGSYRAALVDVPLLFESGFDKECDITLAVIADREIRIERICRRDSVSREYAEARINAQLSDEFLKERCDLIISNNGTLEELESEILRVIDKIVK